MRIHKISIVVIGLSFTASLCAAEDEGVDETGRLNAWLDAQYMEQLHLEPLRKAFFGIKDDGYDSCGDYSEQGIESKVEWARNSLLALETNFERDSLGPAGRDSYDLWEYYLTAQIAENDFRDHRFFLNQGNFAPYQIITAVLTNFHTVRTVNDFEDLIARVESCSKMLLDLLDHSESASSHGVKTPYFIFDMMIPRINRMITGSPFNQDEQSMLSRIAGAHLDRLAQSDQLEPGDRKLLEGRFTEALLKSWLPANSRVIQWMERERAKASDTATGAISLPNGEKYYSERLKFYTTTSMSAEEIHEVGLSNVARLSQQIKEEATKYKISGSTPEVLAQIAQMEKKLFVMENNDDARALYLFRARQILDSLQPKLGNYFNRLPKAELTVKRVEPNREQAGGPAHYFPPSGDGLRPGVFYAHLLNMEAVPHAGLETLAYHEGYPGHHLQNALAVEQSGLPLFRKRVGYAAYGEGWALYAEALAREIPGTYEEPIAKIGHLSSLLFRAARLVVDTGLHQMGWTEDEAIAYLANNTRLGPVQSRSEVRRYIVDPGQATSYFVGMQKIVELRANAETALGEDFDIRKFHDVILEPGPMPLELVERRVNEWLDGK